VVELLKHIDDETYSQLAAAYRGFLNVGDIHSCEPWLYSECLAKNITVRAKEWRKLHQLK